MFLSLYFLWLRQVQNAVDTALRRREQPQAVQRKKQREKFETSHDAELRLFYAARRILKEKLDGKPIALKAWKQEYAQLKTEYAELSPQHKPLREEVIRLRQVQNAVDTALRRREQPQAVQRKKHEMEL